MHFIHKVISSLQVVHFMSASLMLIEDQIMILDHTLV